MVEPSKSLDCSGIKKGNCVMFRVPPKLITVRGGKFDVGSYLMIDLRIDERLIVPTLIFHREGDEDQRPPLCFELDGVGARVITCPLDFHQDIFEANPRDVHFEDDPGTDEPADYTKFFSEVAFARSIRSITCVVGTLDGGEPYVCDVTISFKASRVKIDAHFGQGDTDVEQTSHYVLHH